MLIESSCLEEATVNVIFSTREIQPKYEHKSNLTSVSESDLLNKPPKHVLKKKKKQLCKNTII